jgi:hypothetical protein
MTRTAVRGSCANNDFPVMGTGPDRAVRPGPALVVTDTPNLAQNTIRTPTVPRELPTEVELELAPGSLKDGIVVTEFEKPISEARTDGSHRAPPRIRNHRAHSRSDVAVTPRTLLLAILLRRTR